MPPVCLRAPGVPLFLSRASAIDLWWCFNDKLSLQTGFQELQTVQVKAAPEKWISVRVSITKNAIIAYTWDPNLLWHLRCSQPRATRSYKATFLTLEAMHSRLDWMAFSSLRGCDMMIGCNAKRLSGKAEINSHIIRPTSHKGSRLSITGKDSLDRT